MTVIKEYGIYTVFIHNELFNNIPEAKFTMKFMRGIQYFDLRNIKTEDQLIEKLKQFKGVEDQVILINNNINNNLYEAIKILSINNYIINFIKIEKQTLLKNIVLISDNSSCVIYYNNPKKLKFIIEKTIYDRNKYKDKKYNNLYLWNFRYHMYRLFCK